MGMGKWRQFLTKLRAENCEGGVANLRREERGLAARFQELKKAKIKECEEERGKEGVSREKKRRQPEGSRKIENHQQKKGTIYEAGEGNQNGKSAGARNS